MTDKEIMGSTPKKLGFTCCGDTPKSLLYYFGEATLGWKCVQCGTVFSDAFIFACNEATK